MRKVAHWLEHLANKGIDKERALAGTGLMACDLDDFYPTPIQYRNLLRNIVSLSPPGIGLELGKQFSIADLGALGFAALSSSTMLEVIALVRRYGGLNEIATVYSEMIVGDDWIVTHATTFPLGECLPFHIEEQLLKAMKEIESYTGVPLNFKRLYFSYGEPAYVEKYHEIFRCPLYFGCDENVWLIDSSYRELPVKLANPEVARICEKQCAKLMASHGPRLGTIIRKRLIMYSRPYPSLAEMARTLGLSVTALQRKLRDEGETFAEITDAVRKDFAVDYLS